VARKKGILIAIDGPAGVGKSTIGKAIARELGYSFINTGEMYRALAWKLLAADMNSEDEAAVSGLARSLKWSFEKGRGAGLRTLVDGGYPGVALRSEAVSKTSSAIAKNAAVRELMKEMQRKLGEDGGIVMEGRDIGTVVFPDAELKIYLDANPEVRARRRAAQLEREGYPADYAAILRGIISRDKNDAGRRHAPLKKAPDSVVIDTSGIGITEVLRRVIELARKRCPPI